MAGPNRAHVIAVGIDDYEFGSGARLVGPVDDAVRFARWCLDRGVPAPQIHLAVTPGAPEVGELRSSGVDVRGVGKADIHRLFARDLPGWDGDLLWVLWGGHGAIDGLRRRRLFYADSTRDDPVSLDLESLTAMAASSYVPEFEQQIWIVDACQTHGIPVKSEWVAGAETFPLGQPVPGREQDVLLAASLGQAAVNLTVARTGLFSSEVMRELDAAPVQPWPPDVDQLVDGLRARFSHLRDGGGPAQTPTYLWYRNRRGDEGQLLQSGAAPAQPAPGARPDLGRLREATEALVRVDEFVRSDTREEMLSTLRREVYAAINRQSNARLEAVSVLRTCLRFAGGMAELIETVRFFCADSERAEEFAVAAARL
jgi:hypothetical protein